jgi:hypothetical protein
VPHTLTPPTAAAPTAAAAAKAPQYAAAVQPPPKHVLQRQIEQLISPGAPTPSGGNTSAVLSGKSHVQHSGGPAAGGGAGGVQQQGQQQQAPQAGGTASAAGGDSAGGSSSSGGRAVPGDADVAGWLVRCSVLLEKLSGGLMAAGRGWSPLRGGGGTDGCSHPAFTMCLCRAGL